MLAASAAAEPLTFTYSQVNGRVLSFALDSNPAPLFNDSGFFRIEQLPSADGTFNDAVQFYTADNAGGFLYTDYRNARRASNSGPQLFTGSTAAPQFSPGTFTLFGSSAADRGGTFSIVSNGPAAPGPLAGVGFLPALAGLASLAALRIRRREPAA